MTELLGMEARIREAVAATPPEVRALLLGIHRRSPASRALTRAAIWIGPRESDRIGGRGSAGTSPWAKMLDASEGSLRMSVKRHRVGPAAGAREEPRILDG